MGALTNERLPAERTRAMDLEGLVAEARERRPQPMPARERAVAAGMAVAYLAAAGVVGAAVAPNDRPLHLGTVIALVLLTALTMRAQFEIGPGVASPAALAIVPMLFLAPLHLVPLLVPMAQVISRVPDFVTKRAHVDPWLSPLCPPRCRPPCHPGAPSCSPACSRRARRARTTSGSTSPRSRSRWCSACSTW